MYKVVDILSKPMQAVAASEPSGSTKPSKTAPQSAGSRLLKRAKRVIDVEKAELHPTQPRWWIAFGMLLSSRVSHQRLLQVASSLTFTTVLSLVPMLTVALAIFTAFPMFEELQGRVESYLFEGFFPPNLTDSIVGYLNQFSAKAKGLTAIGTVVLVVTSLMTMLTVDRVFNQIWHVKRQRGLVNKVVLYWSVISLAPLLVGIGLSMTTAIVGASVTLGGESSPVLGILRIVPILVTSLAFALIYQLIPNRAVRLPDALVGGVVAAVLFEVSKLGFAAYVTHFPSYTAVYGALAAIPLFLLWIYLSWIIVLLGATIVAALPVARTGIFTTDEKPGERWYQGLTVLAELEESRHSDRPGMTMEELRVSTRISPDQLDDILTVLIDYQLVGLLTGSKSRERYVMICDPVDTPIELVSKALWFDLALIEGYSEGNDRGFSELKRFENEFLRGKTLADWLNPADRVELSPEL